MSQRYDVFTTQSHSERTTIHRARRRSDGCKVVLKTSATEEPNPEEISALEREFAILDALRGPGVVNALGIEEDGSRVTIILEDSGHGPLTAEGPLPLARFLRISAGIARALARIHARGVIHKDINPSNVLCRPSDDDVQIIDFGIAVDASLASAEERLEGSLAYIAPEQTGRMSRCIDARADLYSLGATLFELLSGSPPFQAEDALGYVHCHLSVPAPDIRSLLPDTPEPVASILAKLLAKSPEARYQTALGLLHDLEACGRQLQETGSIRAFPLASRDEAGKLGAFDRLAERESALDLLAQARAGVIIVSGPEGVGKSALLDRARRQRDAASICLGGRCKPSGEVPLGPLVEALGELADELLAEPDEALAQWKAALSSAVAPSGRVLVDLVSQLEIILGPQPELPALPAREAAARRDRTIHAALRTVAQKRPLVLLFDDIQWADAATTDWFARIAAESGLEYLVIGALREGASGEIEQILGARGEHIQQIALPPLSREGVTAVVSGALGAGGLSIAGALGAALFERTGGNPLFLRALLERLHREGALGYDPEAASWRWDPEVVASLVLHSSAVDMILARLASLGPAASRLLGLAACVGDSFSAFDLERLAEGPVENALFEGLEAKVISRGEGDLYTFVHHSLASALRGALPEDARARAHHRVARALLSRPLEERQRRLFEIVAHLEAALSDLDLPQRQELLDLEIASADRARRASGYAIAARHLASALSVLSDEQWAAAPDKRLQVARERVEAVFASGDIAGAYALCDTLPPLATSPLDRAAIWRLRSAILSQQGQLAEVLDATRSGLGELGVLLPSDPAEIGGAMQAGLGRMAARLGETPPERLVELPKMTDPRHIATMDLLFQAIPAAFQTSPPLFVLCELMMFDLTLAHGVTSSSCKCVADCGILQANIFGDYPLAMRLGEAAAALAERFAPTPLSSAVAFIRGAFLGHWGWSAQRCVEALDQSYRDGVALGDPEHAAYAAAYKAEIARSTGAPLAGVREAAESALVYASEVSARAPIHLADAILSWVEAMREGLTAINARASRVQLDLESGAVDGSVTLSCHTIASSYAILGKPEEAWRWLYLLDRTAHTAQGTMLGVEIELFRALISASVLPKLSGEERARADRLIAEADGKLSVWGALNPQLFGGMRSLVAAELARVRGAPLDEIAARYGEVVEQGGRDGLYLRAVACERYADLWRERRQEKLARQMIQEASRLYERWGAQAKVALLAREQPVTRAKTVHASATQTTGGIEHLDLESVTKAMVAISSEVKIDRLFTRLMQTILESAGAQRCVLLLAEEGQLSVEARASSRGVTLERSPLSLAEDVAKDAIVFVSRAKESVVLDDASAHPRFGRDVYVAAAKVRSLLCVPVSQGGQLIGVLYAENNELTGAFSRRHVKVLQIIAGQVATALANARLYETLEQRVAARTRELSARTHEIEALLDSLPQGVLTVGPDLRIEPRFSAKLPELLGRTDLAGLPASAALFCGAQLTSEQIDLHEAALQFSFGQMPLFAEINWVHLVRQFERREPGGELSQLEIDWVPVVDDAGDIVRFLGTLRDVTRLRALEREVLRRSRETDILEQLLAAGVEGLESFCAGTRERLLEIEAVLASGPLDAAGVELVFRHLHTAKGNARMLGLAALSADLHRIEEPYVQLRQRPDAEVPIEQLRADLRAIESSLGEHESLLSRKLGPLLESAGGLSRQLTEQIAAVASSGQDPLAALAQIRGLLAGGSSVGAIVRASARLLPALSLSLGKLPPDVEVIGGDVLLEPKAARHLGDALNHILRNAIDHGIEAPAQRRAAGKPESGRIELRVEQGAEGCSVVVTDDGRGLHLARLREMFGQELSDEELAEKIFRSGVSTAGRVTEISGRGVGLDAVRAALGGTVRAALTGPERGGFRPFQIEMRLPESATLR